MQRSASPGENSRLNTHSFSCSPSPHRQETMLDKRSQQKNSLFPPIIESNGEWGRRQNFIILYTLAFGEAHWATSVRGRWANFRETCANTNNCSGLLSLSALEVWVKPFNAPQPISFPYFPPSMICPHPRSQSVFHRLSSQSLKSIIVENKLRPRCPYAHKQKQY